MSPNSCSKPKWGHLEYRWRVENFWELRALASIEALEEDAGEVLWSPPFGDSTKGLWRLKLYPYGDSSPGGKGHVSLFLAIDIKGGGATKAYAIFGCYVLDAKGEKIAGSGRSFTRQKFAEGSSSWGWSQFIKVEDQSLSKMLVNDSLSIKCDIDVFVGVTAGPGRELPAAASLNEDIINYINQDSSKDLCVKVGNRMIYTNLFLLCARSKKFRELLSPSSLLTFETVPRLSLTPSTPPAYFNKSGRLDVKHRCYPPHSSSSEVECRDIGDTPTTAATTNTIPTTSSSIIASDSLTSPVPLKNVESNSSSSPPLSSESTSAPPLEDSVTSPSRMSNGTSTLPSSEQRGGEGESGGDRQSNITPTMKLSKEHDSIANHTASAASLTPSTSLSSQQSNNLTSSSTSASSHNIPTNHSLNHPSITPHLPLANNIHNIISTSTSSLSHPSHQHQHHSQLPRPNTNNTNYSNTPTPGTPISPSRIPVFDLSDQQVSEDIMEEVIEYITTDKCPTVSDVSVVLPKLLELYLTSHRYHIHSLTSRCVEALLSKMTSKADVLSILTVADLTGCDILMAECRQFLQHFTIELQGDELIKMLLPKTSSVVS